MKLQKNELLLENANIIQTDVTQTDVTLTDIADTGNHQIRTKWVTDSQHVGLNHEL